MRSFLDSEVRTGLRGGGYLPELECLRGLAVLLVFLFHAWGVTTGGGPGSSGGVIAALLSVGNTGVTLFFVLSGFLLSRPWLRAIREPERPAPDIAAYGLARAARILPLYYGVIIVAALALRDTSVVLPAATFQMLGFDYFPWSVVWWTLVTEMQFYLLLPLLGTLALHGRASRVLLALLSGLWLAWYTTQVAWPTEPLKGFLVTKSVFARLPAFLLGAMVAAIAHSPHGQRRLAPRVRMLLLASGTVGLLLLLLAVARMSEKTAEALWPTYHVWEALGWSTIVLALAGSTPALWRTPLVNPALAALGKLSYSVYLVHVPVLFYTVFPARATEAGSDALLLRVALAGLATLVISVVTYSLVERPFLKLKERARRP